ncbi:MAG TPA: glucans biosynthesis glucosyltransferase MdoH, partial [Verrucomicrobiae bacterium]|nr:glucans biosynthesis glucosyltransferase MdoH [Verrucomicrobiae bacterium]
MSRPNSISKSRTVTLRRLALVFLVLGTIFAASQQTFRVMRANGFQPLEYPIFALFVILMFPVTLGFWTALFGFFLRLRNGDELSLSHTLIESDPIPPAGFRTAVVIPAFNEDSARLFAGLKVIYESVEKAGWLDHFDFFILSDTDDPDVWVQEELAFHRLREQVNVPERVFYRNRREKTERKAGNIADFCATWGEAYRYMVVLDADSIMTG